MRLMSLLSRLFFVLGGLFIVFMGVMAKNPALMLLLPTFGLYFVARGACFLTAALE